MKVVYSLRSRDFDGVAAEAAWAESMGYDGVSTNETAHDSFLPLAVAATSTSRVTLETHVAIAFPRSPMVVAYTARDLQDGSNGRFRLGLGTQVKGHIERRFSTRWTGSAGSRLREYVQSLRTIWNCWDTGSNLEYDGDFYQFSLMTPFFSPGPSEYNPPEVYTAAVNGYNCLVAGEVSDGLMLHSLTSPEYIRQVVQPNVAEGARRAGRNPEDVNIVGGGFIVTGPNQEVIREQAEVVRRRISFYSSTRTYFPVLECHGFEDIGRELHRLSGRAGGTICQAWCPTRCSTPSPPSASTARSPASSVKNTATWWTRCTSRSTRPPTPSRPNCAASCEICRNCSGKN